MPWLGTLMFLWAAVECGWRVEGDGESPACPLFSSQLMSRCSHTLAKVWFSRLWVGLRLMVQHFHGAAGL